MFLRGGRLVRHISIGTEVETYIKAKFVVCPLAELPAEPHLNGANFAGWILSVAMRCRRGHRPRILRAVIERVLREVKDEGQRKLWLGVIEDLARLSRRDWVEFDRQEAPRLRRRKKMRGYFTRIFDRIDKAEQRAAQAEHQAEKRAEKRAAVSEAPGALVAILDFRKLRVTKAQRAQIERCTSRAELVMWHRRAVSAASARDVFVATPTVKRRAGSKAVRKPVAGRRQPKPADNVSARGSASPA